MALTLFEEDLLIPRQVSFLKDNTVLYIVGDRTGIANSYIESHWKELLSSFQSAGFKFTYIPDLLRNFSVNMVDYVMPGASDIIVHDDIYLRIQDGLCLGGRTGFLYKHDGLLYFRALTESSNEEIEDEIKDFIGHIDHEPESEIDRFRYSTIDDSSPILFSKKGKSGYDLRLIKEEQLDERTQALITAWKKIEQEFGVTKADVEILLGYKLKFSRLHITDVGNIILDDYHGKEVKLDDLTKSIYFFYLKHPEGLPLKGLAFYEDEILRYYMRITGREDYKKIRKSIHNHLEPYENNINVSISRIKKAFRDIVDERIASFYYVDGHAGEPYKVALDRNLVIWDR